MEANYADGVFLRLRVGMMVRAQDGAFLWETSRARKDGHQRLQPLAFPLNTS